MSDDDPRTTAFVLGELEVDEARALREQIEREPEAIGRIEEIREIAALMQQSLLEPSALELTSAQRQAIVAAIPGASRAQPISRAPWGFAAAAVIVVAAASTAWLMRDRPVTAPQVADNTVASQSSQSGAPSADGRLQIQGAVPVAAVDPDAEPAPVQRPIVMLDRTGKMVSEVAPPGTYYSFRLSPDGRYIALDQQSDSGTRDIWVRDLSVGSVRRLTFGGGASPVWSPDGRLVIFKDPVSDISYRVPRDGSGPRATVTEGRRQSVVTWSADGQQLVMQKHDPATGWDLWIVSPSGGVPRPLMISPFSEQQPAISPDGRWIAYTSNESGRSEIYVRALGASSKYQVSVAGATASRWRANGSEMFYIAPGGQLMSVDVASKGDTFSLGIPRLLFRIPAPLAAEFEVTHDGQRFILFGGGTGQ